MLAQLKTIVEILEKILSMTRSLGESPTHESFDIVLSERGLLLTTIDRIISCFKSNSLSWRESALSDSTCAPLVRQIDRLNSSIRENDTYLNTYFTAQRESIRRELVSLFGSSRAASSYQIHKRI